MRHGFLLRLLLVGIGLFFVIQGLSMSIMFGTLAFASPIGPSDDSIQPFHLSMLLSSGLGPVLIGTLVLVFASRLEQRMLGNLADRPVEGLETLSLTRCAVPLIRLLGLYLACTSLPEVAGAAVQTFRPSVEHASSEQSRAFAELAAHLVGLAVACLLFFRTDFFARLLLRK